MRVTSPPTSASVLVWTRGATAPVVSAVRENCGVLAIVAAGSQRQKRQGRCHDASVPAAGHE